MKALIFQEKVVQVEKESFEVADPLFWVDCPDDCVPGWVYVNGKVQAPPPVVKPIEELLNEYSSGLQTYLDEVATQRGYQNALYCLSYLNSSISAWQAEAQTFLLWRDSVWAYTYEQLALFEQGKRPVITLQEFIHELPEIIWP